MATDEVEVMAFLYFSKGVTWILSIDAWVTGCGRNQAVPAFGSLYKEGLK
jgi:hypothetical protein